MEHSLVINSETVKEVVISKSAYDYNYCRVYVKVSGDEHININYEWQGDAIPDFILSLYAFISPKEVASLDSEEVAEFKERLSKL